MYNNVMTTQTTIYVLCFKENQKCFCSFSYYLLEDAWERKKTAGWKIVKKVKMYILALYSNSCFY